jgi:hypothetical protein
MVEILHEIKNDENISLGGILESRLLNLFLDQRFSLQEKQNGYKKCNCLISK